LLSDLATGDERSSGEPTMPFGNSHQQCLQNLGKALKHLRNPGEQFCVFAFDLLHHPCLRPFPEGTLKDDLPLDPDEYPDANWTAAFWSITAPKHTEVAIIDDTFWQWLSNYSSSYGKPRDLYIYSALIPCFRDGANGKCSERIQEMMLEIKQRGLNLNLWVGWSNDDVDAEAAHSTKHGLADLQDDGIGIGIFPPNLGMSIQGNGVDAFGNAKP
jgi:hypothetical protein